MQDFEGWLALVEKLCLWKIINVMAPIGSVQFGMQLMFQLIFLMFLVLYKQYEI